MMQETQVLQIAVTVLNVIFLGLFGWGLHGLHRVIARVERMEEKMEGSVKIMDRLWLNIENFEKIHREDMREAAARHEDLRKRVQDLERTGRNPM